MSEEKKRVVYPEGQTVDDKCPFGCIFFPNSNALYGDCRAPQSKDCHVGKLMDKLSFSERTIDETIETPGTRDRNATRGAVK